MKALAKQSHVFYRLPWEAIAAIVSSHSEGGFPVGPFADFSPQKCILSTAWKNQKFVIHFGQTDPARVPGIYEANMNRWLQALTLAISLPSAPTLGGELLGITPDELETLKAQGVPVVDVRTPEEWHKTGVIEGSKPLTFFDSKGAYDAAAWMRQLKTVVPDAARPVVLVCRSGNRTAVVGKMLAQEPGYERVYHLEKGLQVWSAEGHKLTPCGSC